MKNIFLSLFVVLLLSSCATQSSFSSFYQDHKSEADFSLNTPAFFVNVFIPKEELIDYNKLLRKVKKYKIMTFSNENNHLEKKFKRFIKRRNYVSLFRISDDGDKIDFYFLNEDEKIKEIILRIDSGEEYVLLGLKTNILEKELDEILANIEVSSEE